MRFINLEETERVLGLEDSNRGVTIVWRGDKNTSVNNK